MYIDLYIYICIYIFVCIKIEICICTYTQVLTHIREKLRFYEKGNNVSQLHLGQLEGKLHFFFFFF
jgi:hypothetical protein